MIDPLAPFLAQQGFVVLDGGLATELERRGADLFDPLWSAKLLIEAPDAIEQIHYDYFVAGADVGTSASYQATYAGFSRRGLGAEDAERLFRLSVELVRRARDRFWSEQANRAGRMRPLVAASVGCYGASLHDGSEYVGNYGLSRFELRAFHERRLAVLAESGADLIACETIPCRLEAEVLVSLVSSPAWISFSCRNESEVSAGETLFECLQVAAASPFVVAAGVNCTPPRYVPGLLAAAALAASAKPMLCYPNSGERWNAGAATWEKQAGEEPGPHGSDGNMAQHVRTWHRLGARLIGGCCRTGPSTIREIRDSLTEQVITKDAPDRA